MAKRQAIIDTIWLIGAFIINLADDIIDDIFEMLHLGALRFMDLCAGIIKVYDYIADHVSWAFTYFGVHFLRRVHDMRMSLLQYKRHIENGALYFIITGVLVTFLFSQYIDYAYAYNGRTLGVVKEQKNVLEILDLVSEELTKEYGLTVAIDGDTDISFRPILSYGREIDTADAVLKKFTYMGDIQTKAFAIYVDGQKIGTVQSEAVGNDVVESVINKQLKKKRSAYEYVGIVENVRIKEEDTTLSKVTSKESVLKTIDAGTNKEYTYTAEKGDKVKDVAKELGVSAKTLREQNPEIGDAKTLEEGTVVKVVKPAPVMSVKTVGLETFAEVIEYETKVVKSDAYYDDEEFVQTQGKNGKRKVTARITRINGEQTEREDVNVEVITEPVTKVIIKGTKKAPPRQGTGTFIRPVNVGIYSGFGWRWGRMHEGIDLSCATGTPIHAADGGTVVRAGWYQGYGLCVEIDHGNGYLTRYGHCSSLCVSVGTRVYQGQMIARVGSTGWSTGPHCHFEIRHHGVALNPANFV